jgi:hypothetical protein
MTGQLALIEKPPRLTAKQAFALELVTAAGPDGVTAEEVGAAWHAHKGKHPADRYCDWCFDAGRSVLRSKAVAPLVIRRRISGRYQPRHPSTSLRKGSSNGQAVVEGSGTIRVSHAVSGDPFEGL